MMLFAIGIEHAFDVPVKRPHDADARHHRRAAVAFGDQDQRFDRRLPLLELLFCFWIYRAASSSVTSWRPHARFPNTSARVTTSWKRSGSELPNTSSAGIRSPERRSWNPFRTANREATNTMPVKTRTVRGLEFKSENAESAPYFRYNSLIVPV